jgi:broad specificity phosphatase PhoE
MTTFLLVRHGETDAVGKIIAGWQAGWPLNSAGRKQVERLASRMSRFPIKAVYTSPLERTMQTAEAIAGIHGLAPKIREDLGEFRCGAWEGLTFQELDEREDWRRFNTVRSAVRAPGGELMVETQIRMIRELNGIREVHPDETVAVVSHGDPLRSVVAYCLGVPLDFMLRFEISPASLSVVESGDWGFRVLSVNETGCVSL